MLLLGSRSRENWSKRALAWQRSVGYPTFFRALSVTALPIGLSNAISESTALSNSRGSRIEYNSTDVSAQPDTRAAVLHGLPCALTAPGKSATHCQDQWKKYSIGTFPRHLGEFAGCVAVALR